MISEYGRTGPVHYDRAVHIPEVGSELAESIVRETRPEILEGEYPDSNRVVLFLEEGSPSIDYRLELGNQGRNRIIDSLRLLMPGFRSQRNFAGTLESDSEIVEKFEENYTVSLR